MKKEKKKEKEKKKKEKPAGPVPVHERLTHLQSVAQQLAIERAHQMELLLNPTDEELELEDEELIMEVAEYICRTRCVILHDCSTAACGVRCHCLLSALKQYES